MRRVQDVVIADSSAARSLPPPDPIKSDQIANELFDAGFNARFTNEGLARKLVDKAIRSATTPQTLERIAFGSGTFYSDGVHAATTKAISLTKDPVVLTRLANTVHIYDGDGATRAVRKAIDNTENIEMLSWISMQSRLFDGAGADLALGKINRMAF